MKRGTVITMSKNVKGCCDPTGLHKFVDGKCTRCGDTKPPKQESIMTRRPLYKIADEIYQDWKKPYFGAVPYLEAMSTLGDIKENYFCDSGDSVVRYFLANAGNWRGETARRVKAELKELLKGGTSKHS